MGSAFPAKYPGRCADECGQRIEVGDLVRYVDDGDLRSVDCAADPVTVTGAREPQVCPACWLVHAGECA